MEDLELAKRKMEQIQWKIDGLHKQLAFWEGKLAEIRDRIDKHERDTTLIVRKELRHEEDGDVLYAYDKGQKR